MLFIRRAVTFALIWCSLFGLMLRPVAVMAAAPAATREVITAANASKLQPLFKLGKGTIRNVDWSPDGKSLFVSTGSGVYIYNPNDLKQEPRLLDPDGSQRVVFNLAGTKLATFAGYGTVSIWDAKTFKQIDQIAPPTQDNTEEPDPFKTYPPDSIKNVWFDQADIPIIAYEHENDLAVWNSQTRDYLIQNQGIYSTRSVQVSSDRKIMLASNDDSAELWDLKTGEQLQPLERDKDSSAPCVLNSVALSPTNTLIATANGSPPSDAPNCEQNTVVLWDAQTGKSLLTLKGHEGWVSQVVFHPKSELIASGSGDGTIRLWNVKTGKQTALFRLGAARLGTGTAFALAFNPSGTLLAAGSKGGELKIWNVNNNALLGETNDFSGYIGQFYSMGVNNSDGQCCIVFTQDSKQIAHGQGNGVVQAWDTSTGKRLAIIDGHVEDISGLTYANKDTMLISASRDSSLGYWNATSGRFISKQQFPNGDDYLILYALKSSSNGKYMIAKIAPHPGTIWLYSTTSRQKIWDNSKFLLDTVNEPYELPNAFSPDSRFLAFVSNTVNYRLYLYEIGTKKDPIQLPLSCDATGGCTNVPENIVFSADGKRLYVAFRDGAIDILDVERRQVASSLPYLPSLPPEDKGETVSATYFNGTIAVSQSGNNRSDSKVIYVRDLQNGQLLQRYETKVMGFPSLNSQGTLVAWWQNYGFQVWSVETGKIVFEHSQSLNWDFDREIAFSPDGTLLAVAEDEQDVITVYGIPQQ